MEDNKQLEAITYDKGPALVIAGPGSGKTYTLTHHIVNLIESGVKPERILVITFTKAAALEMQSRFKKLMPQAAGRVVFGTFHSVFYRMLKIFNPQTPKIIANIDRRKIIDDITGSVEATEYYENRISYYKSLSDKSNYIFLSDKERDEFFFVYDNYKKALDELELYDFDDIIEAFNHLIREDAFALNKIRKQFSHVCIDEFQDINRIQYDSIKRIFDGHGIIYAVGDEDQSIYGFRGASVSLMRDFSGENVKIIELEKNYRSNKDIIEACHTVIKKNRGRLKQGKQVSIKEFNSKGFFLNVCQKKEEIKLYLFEDINKEISLANKKSIAILLRTNKEVDEYKTMLSNIKRSESTDDLLNEIAYDYISYIEYCLNDDFDNLEAIINRPYRGVSKKMMTNYKGSLDELVKKHTGTVMGDRLSIFKTQLTLMKKLNPYPFSMYLRNVIGHFDYINSLYPHAGRDKLESQYNSIIEISKESKTLLDFRDRLLRILKKPKKNTLNLDQVTITTYHMSKGLEYDVVFLPDVYEGRVPLFLAAEEGNIEEERRLFFVAMSRAKEKLYVYTIKNEESGGTLPSRFLNDFIY